VNKAIHLLIITVCLLLVFLSANAQVKPQMILNDPDYDHEKLLRFGFSVGTNFMDFQITNNHSQTEVPILDSLYFANVSRLYPGFNVNALSYFTIVAGLQLRFSPGLAFGQRNVDFFLDNGNYDGTVKIESSFIELPLHIKYNAQRSTNARPYLVAGGNYRIDLARKSKSSKSRLVDDSDTFFTLARSDIYYEFGAGYEFFLQYFKFSIEFKFSSGMVNVLENYDETDEGRVYFDAINFMRSQIFTLSFNFE